MMISRRLGMSGLLTMAAFAPALMGAARAEEPRRGGKITVTLNADIRSLEPGINRDANTDGVVHNIYEGLVGYRADVSVGPALADSWTVSDDGLVYRFTLREGVRFHNGAPLTAAEVVWSWERQWNNPAWPCRRLFDSKGGLQVVSVTAEDPSTVTYRLARASALFLPQLANLQCGIVVSHPDSVGPDGKWRMAIGTGPWQFGEWKRGEFITLNRFDAYAPSQSPANAFSGARRAWLDQVTFRVIPDPNAAEAGLLTGAVDIIPTIEPERQEVLRGQGMRIAPAPGLGWTTLLLQTRDPVLKDVRIRRALAHAIDIQQIAEVQGSDGAKANPSAVGDSSPFFDDSFLEWPAYDPERARALLREAGYRGQVLKLQVNRRYANMYDNAVAIQSMLATAGFRVELEVLDWATQLNNYLSGNFQLQSFSYSARLDPGLMYSSIIGDKESTPWSQWDDPAAIAILAESAVSGDQQKRAALFHKLHGMMREQVPIIGLYYPKQLAAVRPDIEGFRPEVAGRMITWGVWRAP